MSGAGEPLTQSNVIARSNSTSSNEAPDTEFKGRSNGKFFRRSRSGQFQKQARRIPCRVASAAETV